MFLKHYIYWTVILSLCELLKYSNSHTLPSHTPSLTFSTWELRLKCRFQSCWCKKSIQLFQSNLNEFGLIWPSCWWYTQPHLLSSSQFLCELAQPLDPVRGVDFLFEYELKGLLHSNFMPQGLSDILFTTFSSKCLSLLTYPWFTQCLISLSLCHHPLFFNSLLNDLSQCF